jgi:dTDP-4-dehydrorhamnose 3,5-epimerase
MIKKPENNEIFGVEFKYLKSWPDDRGFFREIIRVTDPFFNEGKGFAQWSHSKMQKNVVKAWHYHHVQFDWWYCGLGQIETGLYDDRPESPTYKKLITLKMGDPEISADTYEVCVKIPPGVLHGLKVHSDFAHLFYITSETYNPNEEGRVAYNDPRIGFNWGENVITVEKDRKNFVPTSVRKLVA